jgi:hypothetical protein
MRGLKTLGLALLVSVILVDAALAFRARNGFRVNQVDQNTFEVIPGPTRAKDAYWCAAGDYARTVLRLDWQTRLYVVRGYADSVTTGRKSAALFTSNPEAAGVTPDDSSFITDLLGPGVNRSVSTAFNKCRSTFRIIEDR